MSVNPDPRPWQRERDTEAARAPTGAPVDGPDAGWSDHIPVKGGLVEAIGASPSRTKVKRHKAEDGGVRWPPASKPDICWCHFSSSDGAARRLLVLPSEICWVPRERKAVGRKDESR
jgi:hypothetical protein